MLESRRHEYGRDRSSPRGKPRVRGHEQREKGEDFWITNNDGGVALCYIVRGSNKGLLIPDSIAEKVITRCRCHARLERGEKWEKLPGTKTPVVSDRQVVISYQRVSLCHRH